MTGFHNRGGYEPHMKGTVCIIHAAHEKYFPAGAAGDFGYYWSIENRRRKILEKFGNL